MESLRLIVSKETNYSEGSMQYLVGIEFHLTKEVTTWVGVLPHAQSSPDSGWKSSLEW